MDLGVHGFLAAGGTQAGHAGHGMPGMDDLPPFTLARGLAFSAEPFFLVGCLLALALYGWAVVRLARRGDGWPIGRTVCFVLGVLTVGVTMCTRLNDYGMVMFSVHMVQHMILSMLSPILLLLGAPVTLALRALPTAGRGRTGPRELLVKLLHSRYLRVVTHPAFIEGVQNDYLEHWRLGRFRFLTGDDKSSWFHVMRLGYDTFYVPDVSICTMKWWDGAGKVTADEITFRAVSPQFQMYAGERRSYREAILFAIGCLRLLWLPFDVLEADQFPYFHILVLRLITWLRRKRLVVTWHEVWGRNYWHEYVGKAGSAAWFIEWLAMRVPDHPIAASLYYEEQRDAAARRADDFRRQRLPRFLGYFEKELVAAGGIVEVNRRDQAVAHRLEGIEGDDIGGDAQPVVEFEQPARDGVEIAVLARVAAGSKSQARHHKRQHRCGHLEFTHVCSPSMPSGDRSGG